MARQTIPQVAGWKMATMMKHHARVLDARRALRDACSVFYLHQRASSS